MSASVFADLAALVTFRPLERPVVAGASPSPFSASWGTTVSDLTRELRAVDARGVVLEVDIREQDLRVDGLPRADRHARTPGVVLSFTAAGVPGRPALRYEVGTYTRWQDNLRAIALGLNALRAMNRYGVTRSGEQYRGWAALPAPNAADPEHGRRLIRDHGGEAAALKATHPDHGGDVAAFRDVQAARGA